MNSEKKLINAYCDDVLGTRDGVELAALITDGEIQASEAVKAAIARDSQVLRKAKDKEGLKLLSELERQAHTQSQAKQKQQQRKQQDQSKSRPDVPQESKKLSPNEKKQLMEKLRQQVLVTQLQKPEHN